MRWLSPQQRQIVEYLCSREDTCTPKEIARHLLTTENTISSQLKKLLELGYVLRSPRGRESLYELAEPLMRLASEVKEKRSKPLRLLVNFLVSGIDPTSSRNSSRRPARRRSASTSRPRSPRPFPPPTRVKILEDEIEKAKEENRLEDLHQLLEEQAQTRGTARSWFELGDDHRKLKGFNTALTCYDRALEIDPRLAVAWNNKGWALKRLRRHEEAIACATRPWRSTRDTTAAWHNKGSALSTPAARRGDHVLRQGPRDRPAKRLVAQKGWALNQLRRHEEAIACYDRALEIDPQDVAAWTTRAGHSTDSGGTRRRSRAATKPWRSTRDTPPRGKTKATRRASALRGGDRVLRQALEIDPKTRAERWGS